MTTVTKSKSVLFFTIASCLYIFLGLGHTAGFILSTSKSQGLVGTATWEVMDQFHPIEMSQHSLRDFYFGDSYFVGLACIAFGIWGFMLARYFKKQGVAVPRPFSALGVVFSVVGLGIAIAYFPAPPIIFLSFISLSFVLAMI
jgi:hypothetical protein